VVDVWDALCSNRPYRPAWPRPRVLDHIRALAGTHFDPRVVEAFLRAAARGFPRDPDVPLLPERAELPAAPAEAFLPAAAH
ncbi:MAG TPA: hypothetical protein VNP72_09010, partial [Longimicrobium sp.]|nr:hypothetical protein [Longimicrobium sp.]